MPAPWGKELHLAQPESPRIKSSHAVVGFILALILGYFAPYLAVVPIVPILIAFLYAYAGLIPAAACAAFSLGSYGLSFGMAGMFMGFVAHIAPAAYIVYGIRTRQPFFRQIASGIAALGIGIVAALGIAYVSIGSDLMGALMQSMRQTMTSMESVYPGLVDTLAALNYNIPGAPQNITQEILLSGFLTAAQRANYVDALLRDMQSSLTLMLPGFLLSTSALAGVLAVAWPGYVKRNDPETTDVSYVPLAGWYTPYGLSIGMILTLSAAYLLSTQKVQGGDTLYMTIRAILGLAFMIQAAVSIERRMQQFGAKTWVRVVIILLIEVIFGDLAVFYGGASALVGSTGAVRQIMNQRANRP